MNKKEKYDIDKDQKELANQAEEFLRQLGIEYHTPSKPITGVTTAAPVKDPFRDLINLREKQHGNFADVAEVAFELKYVAHQSKNWMEDNLSYTQSEAIDMILHKVARILSGDPNTDDHWDDIAGYATRARDFNVK